MEGADLGGGAPAAAAESGGDASDFDSSNDVETTQTEGDDSGADTESTEDTDQGEEREERSAKPDSKPKKGDKDNSKAKEPGKSEVKKPTPRELSEADLDAVVTVKINGEVRKMTVRELQKVNQLEAASNKKMMEAAAKEKQVQHLIHLFENDIDQFAKITGLDVDKIAEARLAKKFELMQMTPDQKKAYELERELQQYKQVENQSKEQVLGQLKEIYGNDLPPGLEKLSKPELEAFAKEKTEEYKKVWDDLNREFVTAWKETGLPEHRVFGAWVAAEMKAHEKKTGTPLQAKAAADKVKKAFLQCASETFDKLDAAAIQEILGKATVEKLRNHDIQRVKAKNDPTQSNRQAAPKKQEAPRKPMNEREWIEYMRSR